MQAILTITFVATILVWDEPAVEEKIPTPIKLVEVKKEEPIVFDKHIYPILEAKCTTCHDREGGLAEGGLDLLTVESLAKGGKHGPALIAGKSEESLAFKLAGHLQKPIMPPADEGEALTGEELSILKQWIDQGAKPGEQLEPARLKKTTVTLGAISPHLQVVESIDISPDGRWLAAGQGHQVVIHDLSDGRLLATLSGNLDLVPAVAISPDGQNVAAGDYERVHLWTRPDPTSLSAWNAPKDLGPVKEWRWP